MVINLDSASELFLSSLSVMQAQTARAQQQISSGYKVQYASDSPDQISTLLQREAELAASTQTATNLSNVKAEVDTGESTVSSGLQLLQNVITLAAQGANSTYSAQDRLNIADQVESLQQQLVALTNTTVQGRYIFSGNADTNPTYQLNLSSITGVDRLATAAASRQIQDSAGASFQVSLTAQDIFDHRNGDDSVAADNVFVAVNSLRLALKANDTTAISAAIDSLHASSTYLNTQLSFYGTVQDRVQNAIDASNNKTTSLKAEISSIRDTDYTEASLALTAGNAAQQAAIAAKAKMPHTSLFDLLG